MSIRWWWRRRRAVSWPAGPGEEQGDGERFDPELGVGMMCRGHCFGNGLIMRAVGDRMIIAPPLTMTNAQIDDMMDLITGCLDATWNDLNRAGKLA
jgi:putrescine aminotransferase